MKKLLHFTPSLFIIAMLMLPAVAQKANAQPYAYGNEISLQTFYDELSPYGQWVDDPEYGYVWIPDVNDPDFRPYFTNGYWVMTDYGNTWVSDYEWGWAPFHYGRWAYTDFYGWIWIPDTVWGPAWVSWRSGGDYYGWAPMGPRISIDIAIGAYSCPDNWWNFVPRRYIYHRGYSDYCLPYYRNRGMVNITLVLGNVYARSNYRYICGPSAYDIRRYGGVNVTVYNINNYNRPGRTVIRNHSVNIYRPVINNRGSNRPSRYIGRNDYANNRRAYTGRGYDNNRGNNRSYGNNNNRRFEPGNGNGRNSNAGSNRNSGNNNNRRFEPGDGSSRNSNAGSNRNSGNNNNRRFEPGNGNGRNSNAGNNRNTGNNNRYSSRGNGTTNRGPQASGQDNRRYSPQRTQDTRRQNDTRRRNEGAVSRTPSTGQRSYGNRPSGGGNNNPSADTRRTSRQRQGTYTPGNNDPNYRNQGNTNRGNQRTESRNSNNSGGNNGNFSRGNGNGHSRKKG